MRKPILRIFSLMLLIAMFLVGEVIAQEEVWDETQEAAHFETCYSDNATADVVDECRYIKRCVDGSAANSTSRGMLECAVQGYKLWDEKLNLEYRALLKVTSRIYGAEAGEALRDVQRAWVSFRDKECYAVQERANFVGFVAGAIHKSCMARVTSERAAQLGQEATRLNKWRPE